MSDSPKAARHCFFTGDFTAPILLYLKINLLCVQGDDIQHDLGAAVHPLHGGALAHAVEVEAAVFGVKRF